MQIEVSGLHEEALLRLMQRNNEKTGAGMIRILIRDSAKNAGLWPVGELVINQSDSESEQTK